MATPSNLVLRSGGNSGTGGGVEFDAGMRVHILGIWNKQCGVEDARIPAHEGEVATYPVNVKLNAEVTKVEGDKGAFEIHT